MELNLLKKLERCRRLLKENNSNLNSSNVDWLNNFCGEFLEFASSLQKFIANSKQGENKQQVEMMCLCLSQVVVCLRQLYTKTETNASRQYFAGRMFFCLRRLQLEISAACKISSDGTEEQSSSFLDLMDFVLDSLAPFSNYGNETVIEEDILSLHIDEDEDKPDPDPTSKEIRNSVNSILSHTLAFANVALEQDKKALSALCQKVLRDCTAFETECTEPGKKNPSNLKLKALSLEGAIYHLEDHINEAILRLVFTSFLDFEKLSVEKIRTVLRTKDESEADEIIADFDVNIDRVMQIGIFAIEFAPSLKIKTEVRSCLASFESLDTSLVPALQSHISEQHSDLLEQHFNEEVAKFKTVLMEIVDSVAFVNCYLEILSLVIEKPYDLERLKDLAQMGTYIVEHFQLPVNKKTLTDSPTREDVFKQVVKMLRECKAILMCASQVQPDRIIKRFKVLRSVLRKLNESISEQQVKEAKADTLFTETESSEDCETLLDSLAIPPPMNSILYDNQPRRVTKANNRNENSLTDSIVSLRSSKKTTQGSIRRKESLRTVMFKRHKLADSKKMYKAMQTESAALQITEVLEQLTSISGK